MLRFKHHERGIFEQNLTMLSLHLPRSTYDATDIAKNEVFHLCAEAKETGDIGPSLDDILSMLAEDILNYDRLFTATERRQRVLHRARAPHKIESHATSRIVGNRRGRPAHRKTHPAALKFRRLAPRARHLRYNHFTRPTRPRRHLQSDSSIAELLDGLSISGGYDGSQVFFKLELDVSKDDIGDLRAVVLKPLQLLDEAAFLSDLNLFSGASSVVDSIFDNIAADISFSAGAHLEVTGNSMRFHFLSLQCILCLP